MRFGAYAGGIFYSAPDYDCLTKQGDLQFAIPRRALLSSSESSLESDVLLPSMREIGTSQSAPSRPDLSTTLRDLVGNVFCDAGDPEVDALQAAISSEVSVVQEAEI